MTSSLLELLVAAKKNRPKNENTSKGKSISKMVRRFQNKSMEDCWLNASLQLVLTGLDFFQKCSINGSVGTTYTTQNAEERCTTGSIAY